MLTANNCLTFRSEEYFSSNNYMTFPLYNLTSMQPVVHPLIHSMISTALSFFILMMRKQQIHTTGMNVNTGSKNGTKNTYYKEIRNDQMKKSSPCCTLLKKLHID